MSKEVVELNLWVNTQTEKTAEQRFCAVCSRENQNKTKRR